jgi:hypothetical protein
MHGAYVKRFNYIKKHLSLVHSLDYALKLRKKTKYIIYKLIKIKLK